MKTAYKLCILIAVTVLILPGAYGALADEPDPAPAPVFQDEPLAGEAPQAAQVGIAGFCTSQASCLAGPDAYCEGTDLCTGGQDATCSNPQGYAECDGTRFYCSSIPTLSVSLSCDVFFRRYDCTANATGGVSPYSYQWSYTGTASYWDSSGNFASASWPPSGCYGYNRFDVTVTDSCDSTASDSDSTDCG